MDEIILIDAIERMHSGEMTAHEKKYFEEMRRTDPELDQKVVEHLYFLNQLEEHSKTRSFKTQLADIHNKLTAEGVISSSQKQATIINLWKKHRRTMGVAASIAGVVSLMIAGIATSVNHQSNNNITPLVQKIHEQENKTKQIEHKLNMLEASATTPTAPAPNTINITDPTFQATGFMVDVNNNYILTNAHVLSQAKNKLIVENAKGQQYEAVSVYVNNNSDLAILRIKDKNFKPLAPLPFSIRKSNAQLGEEIFLLGYPKQEIVYNEGYISAKNGYKMDTMFCQLSTAANEGSSGSPVINKSGELVGVLSSRETNAQGVIFAIKSVNIYRAIESVQKQDSTISIKITAKNNLKGLDRVSQIRKMEDYVFMVKGN